MCDVCGQVTDQRIEQRINGNDRVVNEQATCPEHRFFGTNKQLQFRAPDGSWEGAPSNPSG
jgi:hypothetical protein